MERVTNLKLASLRLPSFPYPNVDLRTNVFFAFEDLGGGVGGGAAPGVEGVGGGEVVAEAPVRDLHVHVDV